MVKRKNPAVEELRGYQHHWDPYNTKSHVFRIDQLKIKNYCEIKYNKPNTPNPTILTMPIKRLKQIQ